MREVQFVGLDGVHQHRIARAQLQQAPALLHQPRLPDLRDEVDRLVLAFCDGCRGAVHVLSRSRHPVDRESLQRQVHELAVEVVRGGACAVVHSRRRVSGAESTAGMATI
ncbi:hypothetical protein BC358_10595 [Hydrogenophaga sp. H7]|nr:hypothetical protein BC358_10595 [Hydrogenophaga sp. H7]